MPRMPLAAAEALSTVIQLAPLALLALLYARRVHTLAGGGHRVGRWRQASFYSGCATIALALTALGSPSDELLWAHMVEHLLLGDIAALLIVLGLSGPLIAPILRIRLFD